MADPGTHSGEEGTVNRLAAALITVGGWFLSSVMLGLVVAAIEAKMENLKKGVSRVVEVSTRSFAAPFRARRARSRRARRARHNSRVRRRPPVATKSANDERSRRLRQTVEAEHSLVLGWTDQTMVAIEELALSNESEGGGTIVVLAEEDKETIEIELAARLGNAGLRGSRVVVRSGSPMLVQVAPQRKAMKERRKKDRTRSPRRSSVARSFFE